MSTTPYAFAGAVALSDKVGERPSVLDFASSGVDYTGATNSAAGLAIADASIGAVGNEMLFPAGTYLVGTSMALNSPLRFAPGAVVNVASGKTLTINGPIKGSRGLVFTGAGAVAVNNARLYPEWTGADNTGMMSDSADAFRRIVAFGTGNTIDFLTGGSYKVASPVYGLRNSTTFEGHGATIIVPATFNAGVSDAQAIFTNCQIQNVSPTATGNITFRHLNFVGINTGWAAWDSATAYTAGETVNYGGAGGDYVCILASTNNNPSSSPTYWQLMVLSPGIEIAGIAGAPFYNLRIEDVTGTTVYGGLVLGFDIIGLWITGYESGGWRSKGTLNSGAGLELYGVQKVFINDFWIHDCDPQGWHGLILIDYDIPCKDVKLSNGVIENLPSLSTDGITFELDIYNNTMLGFQMSNVLIRNVPNGVGIANLNGSCQLNDVLVESCKVGVTAFNGTWSQFTGAGLKIRNCGTASVAAIQAVGPQGFSYLTEISRTSGVVTATVSGATAQFLASQATTIDGVNVATGGQIVKLRGLLAPAWLIGTAYVVGDYSSYAGVNYVSILNGTGQEPDTSPTYWQVDPYLNGPEFQITSVAGNIAAGSFSVGTSYTITSIGTTDFTLIGASSNKVGVTFTATGIGTGTGTANANYNPATAYTVGEYIFDAGLSYVCIANTTGNAPPNATYWLGQSQCTWNQAGPDTTGLEAYNNATSYTAGQHVLSGSLPVIGYVCISNTTGNAPPNATYWSVTNIGQSPQLINTGQQISNVSLSRDSAGIVTATTTEDNQVLVGSSAYIANCAVHTDLNGTFPVTAVLSTTQFQFATGITLTPETDSGSLLVVVSSRWRFPSLVIDGSAGQGVLIGQMDIVEFNMALVQNTQMESIQTASVWEKQSLCDVYSINAGLSGLGQFAIALGNRGVKTTIDAVRVTSTADAIAPAAYSGSVQYSAGNWVTYSGSTYLCILNPGVSGIVPTNATYWINTGNSSAKPLTGIQISTGGPVKFGLGTLGCYTNDTTISNATVDDGLLSQYADFQEDGQSTVLLEANVDIAKGKLSYNTPGAVPLQTFVHRAGDIVWNSTPVAGPPYQICSVASGVPGTFLNPWQAILQMVSGAGIITSLLNLDGNGWIVRNDGSASLPDISAKGLAIGQLNAEEQLHVLKNIAFGGPWAGSYGTIKPVAAGFTAHRTFLFPDRGGEVCIGAGLPTYANNAAALSGGLVAGEFYAVTGSNPLQVAVVF